MPLWVSHTRTYVRTHRSFTHGRWQYIMWYFQSTAKTRSRRCIIMRCTSSLHGIWIYQLVRRVSNLHHSRRLCRFPNSFTRYTCLNVYHVIRRHVTLISVNANQSLINLLLPSVSHAKMEIPGQFLIILHQDSNWSNRTILNFKKCC